MALLFTILSENFSSVFSATTFGGTNFAFSMLTDHGEEQRKKLGMGMGWACIRNVDEAMLEYYRVFAKQIKVFTT